TATADEVRDAGVSKLRRRADLEGYTRAPQVFDGSVDIAIDAPQAIQAIVDGLKTPGLGVPVALGVPVSGESVGSVVLSRQAGRNLLLVSRDAPTTQGLLAAVLISLASQRQEDVGLTVVDRLGIEEDGGRFLAELAEALDEVTPALNLSFMRRDQVT